MIPAVSFLSRQQFTPLKVFRELRWLQYRFITRQNQAFSGPRSLTLTLNHFLRCHFRVFTVTKVVDTPR